jgi:nucleoside-triphosphatase
VTIEGEEGMLASIDRGKPPAVGNYTVHGEEFETLAVPQIEMVFAHADLYVIDEIGRMELLSEKFRQSLLDLMARPSNLLATIALKGKGFIEQLKGRNDIELIQVTRENRDQLPREIADAYLKNREPV